MGKKFKKADLASAVFSAWSDLPLDMLFVKLIGSCFNVVWSWPLDMFILDLLERIMMQVNIRHYLCHALGNLFQGTRDPWFVVASTWLGYAWKSFYLCIIKLCLPSDAFRRMHISFEISEISFLKWSKESIAFPPNETTVQYFLFFLILYYCFMFSLLVFLLTLNFQKQRFIQLS